MNIDYINYYIYTKELHRNPICGFCLKNFNVCDKKMFYKHEETLQIFVNKSLMRPTDCIGLLSDYIIKKLS